MVDINNSFTLSDDQVLQAKDLIKKKYINEYLLEHIRLGSEEKALRALGRKYAKVIAEAYDIGLDDPVEYLLNTIGVHEIFRFILTHPDTDHMTGLARLQQEIDSGALTMSNFWNLPTIKTITDFKSDEEKASWKTYEVWRNSSFSRTFLKGSKNKYFNRDEASNPPGDGIYILSPDEQLLADAHERYDSKSDIYNNASYILKIVYGEARIILGGDAFGSEGSTSPGNEPQDDNLPNAWQYLLNTTPGWIKDVTLLKASHHGLESGFHPEAVELMNPKITIVSEGEKQDQDVQHRYPDETLSTRFYGTIVVDAYDTGEVVLWTREYREDHGSLALSNDFGLWLNAKSYVLKDSLLHRPLTKQL